MTINHWVYCYSTACIRLGSINSNPFLGTTKVPKCKAFKDSNLFTIRVFLRGTPKIFGVLCPPTYPLFIAFLRKNFRKISKFGVLCLAIFLEKFPNISRKFPESFQLFQNRKKNYYFCTQNSSKPLFSSKFGQMFP